MVEPSKDIYVIVPLGILSVIIVLANCSVCAMVCFKKTLRTYTNWLVLSLAVADILTGGVLLPFIVIKSTSVVTDYLITIMLLSGVANICAVTYDRYVAITKPLVYPYRAPTFFKRAIVASWLLPTIYSVLALAWDANATETIHIAYMVCSELFGVVVPYIFITVAYVQIFRYVRQSITMRKDFESSRQQRKELRRISSDAQVAKVFCIVSTAFLFCWLPILYSTTVKTIFNRPDLLPSALLTVSLFTVATSSLVNPLIYAFLKPDFKVVIRNICRNISQMQDFSKKQSILSSSCQAGRREKKTTHNDQTMAKPQENLPVEYDTYL